MKNLIGLIVLGAAAVYAFGAWSLRPSGINAFLDRWEMASRTGDVDAVCNTFMANMTFVLKDQTLLGAQEQSGGHNEMCAYLHKVMPDMARAITSENVSRDHFTIVRSKLHWLTADVSYIEHRDAVIERKAHLRTRSEDHLSLVATLAGLKVTRLESEGSLEN